MFISMFISMFIFIIFLDLYLKNVLRVVKVDDLQGNDSFVNEATNLFMVIVRLLGLIEVVNHKKLSTIKGKK
jgi:hypothetical protein